MSALDIFSWFPHIQVHALVDGRVSQSNAADDVLFWPIIIDDLIYGTNWILNH